MDDLDNGCRTDTELAVHIFLSVWYPSMPVYTITFRGQDSGWHSKKCFFFDGDGKPKGNCDADLIVQAMRDSYEGTAEQYILVTSDGDYTPLVKFLLEKKQLIAILSPAPAKKCSILLKRTGAPIVYLNDKKELVGLQNEKAPGRDAPLQGSFS
jgi:uncharacterized LabA/DUF88 family protein